MISFVLLQLSDAQDVWYVELEYTDYENGDQLVNINEEMQNKCKSLYWPKYSIIGT